MIRRNRSNPSTADRRGSILILVVALLVLMALIGTAALTTNTIDRYATQQNSNNTEVDLLVEGVKNMAKAVLVSDLYDYSTSPVSYRPIAGGNTTYDHWDMPLVINPFTDPANPAIHPPAGIDPLLLQQLRVSNDAWLSPRYPTLLAPNTPTTFNPNVAGFGANPPVWDAIGAPLEFPNGIAPGTGALFDSPAVFSGQITGVLAPSTVSLSYNNRVTDRTPVQGGGGPIIDPMTPTFVTWSTTSGTQVTQPAWSLTVAGVPYWYIAADADGDGVADSGLRKLPVGDVNGLTWYYATRIIDNGSAINVNTSWARDHEFLGNGTYAFLGAGGGVAATPHVPQAANLFTTSIGLAEQLRSYNPVLTNGTGSLDTMQGFGAVLTELGQIDAYRFNATQANQANLRPNGVPNNQAAAPAFGPNTNNVYVDSYGAATVARTDFTWNTLGEELYFGLARRLNHPGVVAQAGTVDVNFRRFSVSDAAANAYHFVLSNPNASKSALELATSTGAYPGAGTATPATGAQVDSLFWSAGNKIPNGLRTPGAAPSTPVDAASYKLSDIGVGYWFRDNFEWDLEYTVGSAGSFGVENPPNYRNRRAMFTTDNPVSNLIPGSVGTLSYTKASVNTAPIGDLYQAFLNVISENSDTPYNNFNAVPPASSSTYGAKPPRQEEMYAYTGMRFAQAPEIDATTSTGDVTQPPSGFPAAPNDTNPQRMFRNTLRDNEVAPAPRLGDRAANYDDAQNVMTTAVSRPQVLQFPAAEMRKLRAWIAAENTVSMRSPRGTDPFLIAPGPNGLNAALMSNGTITLPVDVYVYGATPQPYITEVYANTDTNRTEQDYDGPTATTSTTLNTEPYVAVELFYPYPIQPGGTVSLQGCVLAGVDRNNRSGANQKPPTVLATFAATDAFQAPTTTGTQYGSYIVLENYDSAGTATTGVTYRPRSSGLPATGPFDSLHNAANMPPVKSIYVKDLARVIGGGTNSIAGTDGCELVLLQPMLDAGGNPRPLPYKPLDSFDFTGLKNDSASARAHAWHYSRLGQTSAGIGQPWSFIYPGRYDGGLPDRRHQGVQAETWDNTSPVSATVTPDVPGPYREPWQGPTPASLNPLTPVPSFGMRYNGGAFNPAENASDTATFPVPFLTQLLNQDQPGWNPMGGPVQRFPFGQFARNSDIMQIPYFGAYVVLPAGTAATINNTNQLSVNIIEMNSISMDAAFCEDTDVDDNIGGPDVPTIGSPTYQASSFEQLGRFCPIKSDLGAVTAPNISVDDLDPTPGTTYRYFLPDPVINASTGLLNKGWRYHWTTRLFDFLTVQDPQSDYLPNVLPSEYLGGTAPVLVSNDGGQPGDPTSLTPSIQTAENGVPLHGLININTASWRVLTSINWTPYPQFDPANPANPNPKRDLYTLAPAVTDGEYDFVQGPDGIDDNVEIAKAITWWRDGIRGPVGGSPASPPGPQGPFRTLYDLYRVKALRSYYGKLFTTVDVHEPDDGDGDFSPNNWNSSTTGANLTDGVREDFEEKFILLNRVSNLITTRSDSFTVYIVVQGWRVDPNNKTAPELVVQRRAAFIADRSGISAAGGQLKTVNVPSD